MRIFLKEGKQQRQTVLTEEPERGLQAREKGEPQAGLGVHEHMWSSLKPSHTALLKHMNSDQCEQQTALC